MLSEAIREIKEFHSEAEMKEYIVKEWCMSQTSSNLRHPLFSIDDIIIEDDSEHADFRIGWKDAKYVCIKKMGNINYIQKNGAPRCIGFCATRY